MRKSLFVVLALVAALLVGCASSEAHTEQPEQSDTDAMVQQLTERLAALEAGQSDETDWWEMGSYIDTETDTIYGVGYAKYATYSDSRMAAENQAFAAVARQLITDMETARDTLNEGGGETGSENQQSMQYLRDTVFSEVDAKIIGMQSLKSHTGDDGTVFVQASAPFATNLEIAVENAFGREGVEREEAAVTARQLYETVKAAKSGNSEV